MPRKTTLKTLPADKPGLSQLIFVVLGALTTTTFAPFGWSYLLPILLLPLVYVGLTLSPRDAGKHAFWFGMGLFLSGTYWIHTSVVGFGGAPVWVGPLLVFLLSVIMALHFGLAGWLTSRLASGEPWLLLVIAPAAWVGVEWLRGWILTGFPWMTFGYSQIDTALAGWAPVLGVYGVSAMLLVSVSAIVVAIELRNRPQWIAIGVVFVPWILGGLLKFADWTEPTGSTMQSTLIQGGISQDRKWLSEQREPTLRFYRETTESHADSALVVWPEVAIPAVDKNVQTYLRSIDEVAQRTGQTIVYGILEANPLRTGEVQLFNSVFLTNGRERQKYRKRHLVPFGEYFPVPSMVREWMKMQDLPHRDMTPGDDVQELLLARDGNRIAVAICYEDAYGAEQLYAFPEARLLINVSNDAWFGDSIAPHQHLQIARMRSLEVGRETIRATNTGISAFIDAKGKLKATGAQFEPVVMSHTVQPRTGMTPYASIGNGPVMVIVWLLLAVFWLRSRAS
ncbi:MAG: apolipoprotein N-acyltransferase [Pseudomonadota bacterium]